MKLNWAGWLYGLFSGFIGGGAGAVGTAVTQALTDPEHSGARHLLVMMGTSFLVTGCICAFAYLKQSPLPPVEPPK